MRILVTGGTGFIGSRVVQQLAAWPEVETTVLVRPTSDLFRLEACGVGPGTGKVGFAVGDLCVPDEIRGALQRARPDVVIHLAMVYHPPGSAAGAAVEAVNLHGTLRLLEGFLAGGGRRFVAAGTCFEYGPHDLPLLDEGTPCRPNYDYAIAKLRATEAILDRGRSAAVETLVLRVFAPYGTLEDVRRLVPQLLATGLSGQRLPLTPGEQVRDYVFVEDVARAFVKAGLQTCLRLPQAVYNVSTGVGYSLRQLAAAAAHVLGRPLALDWGQLPYRPNEMMRLVGDNRRIAADLAWSPACSLDAGLARTAAGLQSGQEGRFKAA